MSRSLARPILWCYPVILGTQSQMHEHEYIEVFFCTGGVGHQHLVTSHYLTRPGDLFFFPCGLPHCASALEGGQLKAYVLQMDASWLGATTEGDREALLILDYLSRLTAAGEIHLALEAKTAELLERELAVLAEVLNGFHPGFRLRAKAALLSILAGIQGDSHHREALAALFVAEPLEWRLANTLRFIDEHSHFPLSVEEMASMACLSRSHFHALFKATTGMTFMNYLNAKRVRQAVHFLHTTFTPITSIALQCGFPSLSHFYHIFRRLVGKTPRQVRLEEDRPREIKG